MDFKEIANRDAWYVIRGYVYQVDYTILKWINLANNEILELEKGEDIDIINDKITEFDIRELEQVKYLENNITLNNEKSLETILNYFLHRTNNPNTKIIFRFITNTSYGIERPAIFISGEAGIDVWNKLCETENIDVNDNRLILIKDHLKNTCNKFISRKDAQTNNWLLFSNYLKDSSPESFKEFIFNFNWSINKGDATQINETIKQALLSKFKVEKKDSEQIYSKLFLYVFKLLTHKETKQLALADLNNCIKKQVSQSDQLLLNLLKQFTDNIHIKLLKLESDITNNASSLLALTQKIETQLPSDTVFEYHLKNFSISHPSQIVNGSERDKKVNLILERFKDITWISLCGINGSGKTQLAALVSNKFEQKWWLDLRSYNSNEHLSYAIFLEFLKLISSETVLHNKEMWVTKVASLLPKNSLIILNDIPRVNNPTLFSETLILLANAFSKYSIKLLTTSNYTIPENIKSSIETDILFEYGDLQFTDEETIEYLLNSGAPSHILNYLSLITSLSERNPRLTTAMIQHLKNLHWGTNSTDVIDILLKKEFTNNILSDAQLSITTYLYDPALRELLYRLSLISWEFDLQIVKNVCQVDEKILHHSEKLQQLVNIWIQGFSNDTFQISPLIKDIGKNNLTDVVIKNTHLAIANTIIESKQLDQVKASRAITEFISAQDYDQAGIILSLVYRSARTKQEILTIKEWGYLYYWSGINLPEGMHMMQKISIRSEQVRLFHSLGEDTSFYKNQLKNFSQADGVKNIERLALYATLLFFYNEPELQDFWKFYRDLLLAVENLEEPYNARFREGAHIYIKVLWVPILKINTEIDIRLWLENITHSEDIFKTNFFDDKNAETAITVLASKLVDEEYKLEKKNRKWDDVINSLYVLYTFFEERKFFTLAAIVLKEIISCTFQYKNDIDKALNLTIEKSLVLNTNTAKYLLYENIGKLFFHKQNPESLKWLQHAIDLKPTDQLNLLDTLIYASSILSDTNKAKALEYCIEAKIFVDTNKELSDLNYIMVLGELGLAYWINNDLEKSFEIFEEIVIRLFDSKGNDPTTEWKRLFKISSHTITYIGNTIAYDEIPKMDGVDYFKPKIGHFIINKSNLSELYDQFQDALIYGMLAIFADGIKNNEKSYKWSLKAFDTARKHVNGNILLMIASACSQFSLISFKIREALESYLLFAAFSTCTKKEDKAKFSRREEIKLEEILESKPSKNWDEAENLTILTCIIPAMCVLFTDYLRDSSDKEVRLETFTNAVKDYEIKASNPILWTLVEELTRKTVLKEITTERLIKRANTFAGNDKRHEQLMCLLCLLYLSDDRDLIINQILGIFPFIQKTHGMTRNSVSKNIIIPFLKEIAYKLVALIFSEQKNIEEYNLKISMIEDKAPAAMQLILKPIIEYLNFQITEETKQWLYNQNNEG
ncbi:MAG: hypothetical protein JWN78_1090 [Bacteroidota bacterium]|nr:hypothetical protein [Bacteroidota bacterium]